MAVTPDRQLAYAYIAGVFTAFLRDYVAVVDLEDEGDGTVIRGVPLSAPDSRDQDRLPRRILESFLRRCADGLAAEAASRRVG